MSTTPLGFALRGQGVLLLGTVEAALGLLGRQYSALIAQGTCPVCRKPMGARSLRVPGFSPHHHFASPCGHHLWSDWGHHRDPRVDRPRPLVNLLPWCSDGERTPP